jgi:hypothetical protein
MNTAASEMTADTSLDSIAAAFHRHRRSGTAATCFHRLPAMHGVAGVLAIHLRAALQARFAD